MSHEPPPPPRPITDSPTVSGERTYLPLAGDSGVFKKPPKPNPPPPPEDKGDQWSNFRRPEER